jgi:hypothetical protein
MSGIRSITNNGQIDILLKSVNSQNAKLVEIGGTICKIEVTQPKSSILRSLSFFFTGVGNRYKCTKLANRECKSITKDQVITGTKKEMIKELKNLNKTSAGVDKAPAKGNSQTLTPENEYKEYEKYNEAAKVYGKLAQTANQTNSGEYKAIANMYRLRAVEHLSTYSKLAQAPNKVNANASSAAQTSALQPGPLMKIADQYVNDCRQRINSYMQNAIACINADPEKANPEKAKMFMQYAGKIVMCMNNVLYAKQCIEQAGKDNQNGGAILKEASNRINLVFGQMSAINSGSLPQKNMRAVTDEDVNYVKNCMQYAQSSPQYARTLMQKMTQHIASMLSPTSSTQPNSTQNSVNPAAQSNVQQPEPRRVLQLLKENESNPVFDNIGFVCGYNWAEELPLEKQYDLYEQYNEAAKEYEQLAKQDGPSAELYKKIANNCNRAANGCLTAYVENFRSMSQPEPQAVSQPG